MGILSFQQPNYDALSLFHKKVKSVRFDNKEGRVKQITLLLLIDFLLSSCATVATAVIPTPTQQPTLTFTPATITQTPSPTPTIIPTPTQIGGGSGKFIFEYYKVAYQKAFPDLKGEVNIFTSNVDGSDISPITNGLKGFNHIENISADGKMVLVSSRPNNTAKGDLYLIHLNSPDSNPIKLASGLVGSAVHKAIFLDNTRVVYLGQGSDGYGFYIINIDGTSLKKISTPNVEPWEIVSSEKTRVYWDSIQKEPIKDSSGVLYENGDFQTLWWINIDGSGQGKLESNGQQIVAQLAVAQLLTDHPYAFSPDGKNIAWISASLEPGCSLLGLALWTPWVRDGEYTKEAKITSIFLHENSPHFGKVIDLAYVEDHVRHCFVMHVASLSNMDNDIKIPLIPPFNPATEDFFYHKGYSLTWSPDGSKILAYDGGDATRFVIGVINHYPLAIYEVNLKDASPKLTQIKILSDSPMSQPGSGGAQPHLVDGFTSFRFSPDSRQILFSQLDQNYDKSFIKVLNLETMNYEDDFSRNITPDMQVQRVGDIYWLP